MATKRDVEQGVLQQGVDESIPYTLTTTPWGSSPTSVSVKAYARTGVAVWSDVTSTVLAGTATVSGDIITLPALSALTEGVEYRIEVKFTSASTIFEAGVPVQATR